MEIFNMAQLNKNDFRPRQALENISREYPDLWKYIDEIRAKQGKELKSWPGFCFLPLSLVKHMTAQIYSEVCNPLKQRKINIESARINSLAAWRLGGLLRVSIGLTRIFTSQFEICL